MNFFKSVYSQEEIDYVKHGRMAKDKFMDGNKFDADNRWIGDVGEATFRFWCDINKITYKHWTEKTKKDLRDFTIGTREIDVKTQSTGSFPRPDYDVSINTLQAGNTVVNSVFFCFYIHHLRMCLFCYEFCWMEKEDFIKNARLFPVGYDRGRGRIVKSEEFSCLVGDLFDIQSLLNY